MTDNRFQSIIDAYYQGGVARAQAEEKAREEERAIAAQRQASENQWAAILPLIHDRMVALNVHLSGTGYELHSGVVHHDTDSIGTLTIAFEPVESAWTVKGQLSFFGKYDGTYKVSYSAPYGTTGTAHEGPLPELTRDKIETYFLDFLEANQPKL